MFGVVSQCTRGNRWIVCRGKRRKRDSPNDPLVIPLLPSQNLFHPPDQEKDIDSLFLSNLSLSQQILQSLRVVLSEPTSGQSTLSGLLRSSNGLSSSDLGGRGVVFKLFQSERISL
jgi:hypothetical protein